LQVEAIATGETVQDGKAAFQQYGLMNHGSILGNGAYYGEDYTAETLELKVEHMREYYAQEEHGAGYDSLGFLQLEVAFTEGYAAARGLAFYEGSLVQTLFWARLPGDTLIILGTAIYVADLIRKRFVLRSSADDPSVDDMAVAEGIIDDD